MQQKKAKKKKKAWQCDGCQLGPEVHRRLAYQPKLWLCHVTFGKSISFSLGSLDHWRQSNSVILMSWLVNYAKRVILASYLSQSLYASPHGFFAPLEDGENAEAMQAWQCDGCHMGPKVHCRLAYQPKLWLCLVSFGKSSFFSLRSLDHWRQSNSVILMSWLVNYAKRVILASHLSQSLHASLHGFFAPLRMAKTEKRRSPMRPWLKSRLRKRSASSVLSQVNRSMTVPNVYQSCVVWLGQNSC